MKSVSTHKPRKPQNGLTLIELIIGIVVLGIAAVAITATLSRTNVLNTDPLLRVQSLSLAESYLEEVLARPFYQPEGNPMVNPSDSPAVCPSSINSPTEPRDNWSVCDYDGFTELRDPGGIELTGLSNYNLQIDVTPGSDPNWESTTSLPADDCILRIDVSVTPPSGPATQLTGYRTSYWEGCS